MHVRNFHLRDAFRIRSTSGEHQTPWRHRLRQKLYYWWVIGGIWSMLGCPLGVLFALCMPPLRLHHLLDLGGFPLPLAGHRFYLLRGCSLWFIGHRFVLTRGPATLATMPAAVLAILFTFPLATFAATVFFRDYKYRQQTKWLCPSCQRTSPARRKQCPTCGTPLVRRTVGT